MKAYLCRDDCCSGHFSTVCQYVTKVFTNFSPIPCSVPRLLKYSDLLFLSNLFWFHLLIHRSSREYFLTDWLYFNNHFSDSATWTGFFFLNILLTVHLSITLVNDHLDEQFILYNTFNTVLYMFRATSCSSSEGQIVLMQHLV